jgi:hypothetical protein
VAVSKLVLILTLASCGLFGGEPASEPSTEAPAQRPGARRAQAARQAQEAPAEGLPLDGLTRVVNPPSTPLGTVATLPKGTPATVVLVILDTVRASHLQVCGYERPTSPVLATMDRLGGVLTCNAYSPATWTLPSHATYFTGQPLHEHDVHRKGLRLPEEARTLAEIFSERGYQTVLLSANPVLKAETGLQQGFQRVILSNGLVGPLRGEGLSRVLRRELGTLDKTEPLFLVINVFDAHEPYAPVPPGIPWVPERGAMHFDSKDRTDANPYYRFIQGTMTPEDQTAWLAHVVDTYDFGVAMADRSAGKMLKLLEAGGWIDHGARVVVTSDHGEHLGEHGLVRHDGPPWEGVSRVPFLYVDTLRKEPIVLPEPFAAANLFPLLVDGELPEVPIAVTSASIRYGKPDKRYVDAVAYWPAVGEKLMWMHEEMRRFDLVKDPGELEPLVMEGHPGLAVLEAAVERQRASKERALGREVEPGVEGMLEGLGYVE